MRVVFLFSFVFACFVVWLTIQPDYAIELAQSVGESAMTTLYEREVRIEGGDDTLQRDVFTRIKKIHSNLEIRFFPEEVEKKILSLSRVQKATIRPCDFFHIDCYVVEIEERVPRYIVHAPQGKTTGSWLASEDGSFIMSGSSCPWCITIVGIETMTAESSEASKRILSKVSLLSSAILEKLRLDIDRVEFLSSQELSVSLKGSLFWNVLFSFPYEETVYKKELERLGEVINQFKGKEQLVKKVELSYDKMAVITLHEGVALAPPAKKQ